MLLHRLLDLWLCDIKDSQVLMDDAPADVGKLFPNVRAVLAEGEVFAVGAFRIRSDDTESSKGQVAGDLEDELGFKLFDRDRSKVDLTPAGGFLYDKVEVLLGNLDETILEAKERASVSVKPLRIGTNSFLNLPVLMKTKIQMQARHPEIVIDSFEMPTSEVFDAVKEKQVDLGFGPIPTKHPALIIKKVITGFWSLTLPRTHPLANDASVDLSQLKNVPLVCFDKALNPKLYNWLLAQFKAAGVQPKIIFETRQIQSGLQMARESDAGFIVGSYLVDSEDPRYRIIPITGMEDGALSVYGAWREENDSPALIKYLDILREQTGY